MKSELLAEFDLKLSLYNVLIHRQINQLEKKIEKYLWKTFFSYWCTYIQSMNKVTIYWSLNISK